MPAGIGLAAAVGAVGAVDETAGWLPAFASALHRDARAPVNLTPIAGLERRLHHLQGDARLALRAARESVLQYNATGQTHERRRRRHVTALGWQAFDALAAVSFYGEPPAATVRLPL